MEPSPTLLGIEFLDRKKCDHWGKQITKLSEWRLIEDTFMVKWNRTSVIKRWTGAMFIEFKTPGFGIFGILGIVSF